MTGPPQPPGDDGPWLRLADAEHVNAQAVDQVVQEWLVDVRQQLLDDPRFPRRLLEKALRLAEPIGRQHVERQAAKAQQRLRH